MLWWNSVRKNKEAVITSNSLLTFRTPSGIIITSVYPYRCICALAVVPVLFDVTCDLYQASIPLRAALVAAHFHMDGYPVVSGTAPGPCRIPGRFQTRWRGTFRRSGELWGWESAAGNWVLPYLATHLADQTMCPQFIYTQAHTLGWIFPDMNIVTVYLKTAINRSLSGPYKGNWVLGSFKASCLIKSGKNQWNQYFLSYWNCMCICLKVLDFF